MATRSDNPVKEIWNILSLPVLTTIAPPRVVHKSGDVTGTVVWVWVIQVLKDLLSGITMEEIDVHGVCLGVLGKTAVPWEFDVSTGSSRGAPCTYRQRLPIGSGELRCWRWDSTRGHRSRRKLDNFVSLGLQGRWVSVHQSEAGRKRGPGPRAGRLRLGGGNAGVGGGDGCRQTGYEPMAV